MKLLFRIDYNKHLLLDGANVNVGAFLSALNGAQVVTEEGYGADKRYVPAEGPSEFTLVSIDDNSPLLPAPEVVLAAVRKEKTDLTNKLYLANKELAELKNPLPKLPDCKPAPTSDIPF